MKLNKLFQTVLDFLFSVICFEFSTLFIRTSIATENLLNISSMELILILTKLQLNMALYRVTSFKIP
jgi:hypothetical protein